ncbi:hypothetical protein GCM10009812_23310 [Nocardioides marinus]
MYKWYQTAYAFLPSLDPSTDRPADDSVMPQEPTGTNHECCEALWSVEQLSDYLQVPIQTLYAWRSRGTGPRSLRVGRYVRYRHGDVAAWLAGRAE